MAKLCDWLDFHLTSNAPPVSPSIRRS